MTIQNNTKSVVVQITQNSRKAATAAAYVWHSGIVETLTGERSGREYKIGRMTRYRASRAGEPPASRTGKLRTSYKVRVVSDNEVDIGSPLDYAMFLEKGTSKIAPRPHVIVGYKKKEREIEQALSKGW